MRRFRVFLISLWILQQPFFSSKFAIMLLIVIWFVCILCIIFCLSLLNVSHLKRTWLTSSSLQLHSHTRDKRMGKSVDFSRKAPQAVLSESSRDIPDLMQRHFRVTLKECIGLSIGDECGVWVLLQLSIANNIPAQNILNARSRGSNCAKSSIIDYSDLKGT